MSASSLDHRILVSAGLILIAVSGAVLSAWMLGEYGVERPFMHDIPMQMETALGLLATAVGLLSIRWKWRRLALAAAAVVGLLGLGVLIQYFGEWNIPRDLPLQNAAPGVGYYGSRMAPNTAVAFLLAACALALLQLGDVSRSVLAWMPGLCGFAIVLLAGISAVWTLSGLGLAPLWPVAADMALPTAAAFGILGSALMAISWRHRFGPGSRLAAAVGGLVIAASAIMWIALEKSEHRLLAQIAQIDAQSAARTIELRQRELLGRLSRFSNRIARGTAAPGALFAVDAQELVTGSPFMLLAWADSSFTVRQIEALDPDWRRLVPQNLARAPAHRQALAQALRRDGPVLSDAVRLGDGGLGVYAYVPVIRDGELLGVLAGVVDLDAVFDEATRASTERGYSVAVQSDSEQIYGARARPPLTARHVASVDLPAGPDGWRLLTWPTPSLVVQQHSPLPVVVLALGVAVGVLLALALRTRQQLAATVDEVEHLNADLEHRVQVRTQRLAAEVHERERLGAELAHAAKHDALTDLPNRALFREHLEQALARARRDGSSIAVMFLDLDHFKEINDTLGHQRGDELLVEFARRIRRAVRQSDIVARQGGDEFLVLAEDLAHPDAAAGIAAKILESMRAPIDLGERHVQISTSIGIATRRDDIDTPDALIKHADTALYQAKAAGRGRYAFYSAELHHEVQERAARRLALEQAVARDQLIVHYQPRLDLRSNSMVGAEALVRWRQHDGRLVLPDAFIPLAEESDLIVELGERVICQVVEDLKRWRAHGLPLPTVSVNVSARQFAGKTSLARFSRCLADAREFAPYIELELTERLLITCHKTCHIMLGELARSGYRIAIDDFGTGYSSLSYLSAFPVHTIKIDKSFVGKMTSSQADATIIRSIVGLAQNFGLRSVAEGVENLEQRDSLERQGCDEAQGFLFSAALPPEEFQERWYRRAS